MNFGFPRSRLSLAALALCSAALVLKATDAPVVSTEASPIIAVAVSGSVSGKTGMKHNRDRLGEVGVDAWQCGVTGSPFEGLNVGLSYEDYRFRVGKGALAVPEHLRSLSLPVSYSRELFGNWTMLAMAAPTFNTAGGEGVLSSDGLGITTGVGVRWQATPELALSLGLAYDSMAQGSLRVLPIVGIEWGMSRSWTLNVGFPETSLVYSVTDSLKLALKLEGTGGSYHVSREPDASARTGLAGSKLEYYDVRLGLCTSYVVGKDTTLALSVGQVLHREFDYHRAGYKLKSRNTAPYIGFSASRSF